MASENGMADRWPSGPPSATTQATAEVSGNTSRTNEQPVEEPGGAEVVPCGPNRLDVEPARGEARRWPSASSSSLSASPSDHPSLAMEAGKLVCQLCSATETSLWRRGPAGPRTLCNACGVKWTKGKLPSTSSMAAPRPNDVQPLPLADQPPMVRRTLVVTHVECANHITPAGSGHDYLADAVDGGGALDSPKPVTPGGSDSGFCSPSSPSAAEPLPQRPASGGITPLLALLHAQLREASISAMGGDWFALFQAIIAHWLWS